MTPFGRFALVFLVVVLALCLFGVGPFFGLGLVSGPVETGFALVTAVIGAVFGLIFGALGLLIGCVAMIPFMLPMLLLLAPLLLLVGLIALACRASRG